MRVTRVKQNFEDQGLDIEAAFATAASTDYVNRGIPDCYGYVIEVSGLAAGPDKDGKDTDGLLIYIPHFALADFESCHQEERD